MKLAEALQERADLNRNIAQLKNRLSMNALIQEGEKANEDPRALKRELDHSVERLAYLLSKINLTNSKVTIDGLTLTEIIAKKDALLVKIDCYKEMISSASQSTYRARGSEIKIKPTIDVAAWQKEVDKMAKEIRRLDNELQKENWTSDLIE